MAQRHNTYLGIAAALGCCLSIVSFNARAADWPQYRGANGDGISTEVSPEKAKVNWGANGPKTLWTVPTSNGFSSFAVSGGKAFTQVNRNLNGNPMEILLTLDAGTGKELWIADVGLGKYDDGGQWGTRDNRGGDGPRSTPTVNDGKVYVFGQFLVLYCFDAETGRKLWTRDLMKDHAGRPIDWKHAASPVVEGDLVFIAGGGAGQSLLALNKGTGEVAWKAFDEVSTHATPVVKDGHLYGMFSVKEYGTGPLKCVELATGKIKWSQPNFGGGNVILVGDTVLALTDYGQLVVVEATPEAYKEVARAKVVGGKCWSTPALSNGRIYVRSTTEGACVDLSGGL